jgi:roadblock/LC7 domain-containing protein
MAANAAFLRKLASDELRETLFFATGQMVERQKSSAHWMLTAGKFSVKIVNNRNISVNGDKCRSVPEAKWVIQNELGDL